MDNLKQEFYNAVDLENEIYALRKKLGLCNLNLVKALFNYLSEYNFTDIECDIKERNNYLNERIIITVYFDDKWELQRISQDIRLFHNAWIDQSSDDFKYYIMATIPLDKKLIDALLSKN